MGGNRFGPGTKMGGPSGDVPAPIVGAVLRAVRDAELLFVAFPRLHRALIVDPRPGDIDYPAALVATLAYGAGAAAGAVERLRPGRPGSARAIATTWGGSVRAFADQGVLAAIIAKLPPEAEEGVRAAYVELQEAERAPVKASPPRLPCSEPH